MGRGRVGNRVVLITGASSGIGAATARILSRGGARLGLIGRDRASLDAVRDSLGAPDRSIVCPADVQSPAELEHAVATVEAEFLGIDAVIAAAGVGSFAPLAETPVEVIREVVETNLLGVIHTVRATTAPLRRKGGHIVLVGSASGRRGIPGLATYSATKAALYGFADALRIELGPQVRVSVVAPDATRTAFFDRAFGDGGVARGADPEVSAALVIRALESGAPTVDARSLARLRAAFNALFPGLTDRWIRWRSSGGGHSPGRGEVETGVDGEAGPTSDAGSDGAG